MRSVQSRGRTCQSREHMRNSCGYVSNTCGHMPNARDHMPNARDHMSNACDHGLYTCDQVSRNRVGIVLRENLSSLFKMASVIHQSQKTPSDAYGCNWLQRLRQLKRIQSRATCAAESQTATGSASRRTQNNGRANIVDFTEYILQ